MTLVLCWDIDGTLLTTARAGILAWEQAACDVLGERVDFSAMETAGLTDVEIARRILKVFGRDEDAPAGERLLRRYEAALPACLPRRTGAVLPGVVDILERVARRQDIVSILLTGNTKAGAWAKLRHYGLDHYFDAGAFADGAEDRPTIARRAIALAETMLGVRPKPDRLYVIGDTLHDIHCARVVEARAIAVASGSSGIETLKAHGPWWVVERLPDPDTFFNRLDGIPA